MEPFIHDAEFPFVFCRDCQWACITDELATHLRRHHPFIPAARRRAIIQEVQQVPGLIQNQDALQGYILPTGRVAIPYIQAPKDDGLRCRACGFVVRQVGHMQAHCRTQHGWINDWKHGGNIKARAREAREVPRDVPWAGGVWCQKLFPSRAASSWFEVKHGASIGVSIVEAAASTGGSAGAGDEASGSSGILAMLDEWEMRQEQRFQQGQAMRRVEALDPKNEANSWLQRVGWTRHLAGFQADEVQQWTREPDEEEALLQCMSEQCHQVLEEAYRTCRSWRIGLSAMFEMNRREVGRAARRPFEPRMEADSWARYKGVMLTIIRVVHRTWQQGAKERPAYMMTSAQGRHWKALEGIYEGMPAADPAG